MPLIVLLAFVAAVAWRLTHPPDTAIRIEAGGQAGAGIRARRRRCPAKPGLASADLATGEPRLVNIFASWCVPCIAEAPVLTQLASEGVAIDGIAIRDRPEDVAAFLAATATRSTASAPTATAGCRSRSARRACPKASSSMAAAIIRYQHIGPIEPGDVPTDPRRAGGGAMRRSALASLLAVRASPRSPISSLPPALLGQPPASRPAPGGRGARR